MDEGTASCTLFENSATELVQLLTPYPEPEARALQYEARKLVEVFRGWARKRPSDEERITLINQLFSLTRSAMEFHTSRRPPSSRPSR